MVELKLPKLPDRTPVKITIVTSAELHRDLVHYADAYRATYGTAESIADLIPFMLAAFMTTDGGFKKLKAAN